MEESNQDRLVELKKAFDDTKAGVKGLVDEGIDKVPEIFLEPKDKPDYITVDNLAVPEIDLSGLNGKGDRRTEIVNEVRIAAEKWGFFQVLNHGIPEDVMKNMMEGVRKFHEQPTEEKKKLYSRSRREKVKFQSNFDLFQSKAANWRDTLVCVMIPDPPPTPDEYPEIIRDELLEYAKHVKKLAQILLELLSEALGLDPNYLRDIECNNGHSLYGHYYPACPEPDLTLGHAKHHDPDFLSILLQDHIGGLQVLYDNQWVNVKPIEGALVINIGDLLQLITNDKFKSVEHRVLAHHEGPRISGACLFVDHFRKSDRRYGPIEKLLSKENPPLYNDASVKEFYDVLLQTGLGGGSPLASFRKTPSEITEACMEGESSGTINGICKNII